MSHDIKFKTLENVVFSELRVRATHKDCIRVAVQDEKIYLKTIIQKCIGNHPGGGVNLRDKMSTKDWSQT